jgi:hypothetical protein
MRFPRTIGFRITLGFGLIIIAIIINVVLSQRIVSRIQTTQQEVSNILEPSIRLTEIIIGVIEIASLEIIQDFQIEFVERIGSTIASSLSGEHAGSSPTKNPA